VTYGDVVVVVVIRLPAESKNRKTGVLDELTTLEITVLAVVVDVAEQLLLYVTRSVFRAPPARPYVTAVFGQFCPATLLWTTVKETQLAKPAG
jgi:hypothetical protein